VGDTGLEPVTSSMSIVNYFGGKKGGKANMLYPRIF